MGKSLLATLHSLHILVVEDSEDDTQLLLRHLRSSDYEVTAERVETREEMLNALAHQSWDIVFADYTLPHFSGLEAIRLIRGHDPDVPIILISGTIGEERAIEVIKAGAQDYLLKGNIKRLLSAVARELEEAALRREHRKSQERLKFLAYYDQLTGLPNRAYFLEQVAAMLTTEDPAHQHITVLTAELSEYHEINATLGYTAGDALLCRAGERLQQLLPSTALLAILGSGRYAMALAPSNLDYAHLVADKLHSSFNEPFDIADFRVNTGIYLGAAQYPDHGQDAQLLLRRAEAVLKLAHGHATGYAAYSAERDSCKPENIALATDLRNALGTEQLRLYFQPKVDFKTGRLAGVEALVRWEHPQQGLITPDRFVVLAEKSGLIIPLTQWVLDASVKQHLAWAVHELNLPIAANLSVRNLLDRKLMDQLYALILEHNLPPGALEAEVTESALMEYPQHAIKTLNALRDMGVQIYIDDFGTGYSSLAYLKRLPIDGVKIDKSFVSDVTTNPDSATIVRSTIELAHNLGLQVVAEGVEEQSSFDCLAALGCDKAQGYYISRPLSAQDFELWHSRFISTGRLARHSAEEG